jgi:tetratricopeptide (TPR) repeat protein
LNRFVSKDILGRVNPFLSGSVHESLEEAVTQASPEIDKEFRNEPQMAGSLHLELARDLEARSSYAEARREYQRAIDLFQRDKGSGAEDAVRAELQEAGMEARWFRPGTLESARKLLASAESEMPKLGSRRAPDLEVWRLAASGSIAIIEAHPRAAVTDFSASIQAAKGIPGFDSASLQTLKGYLAGAYMRIPDGASAERLCREMIQEAISRGEGDSAATLRLRTSLAQSLFVQGKYPELIEEADAVYPQLVSRLGVDHSACLRLLSSRAAAAGHLGLWQRCMSDDMAVYQVLVRKQGPISFLALATLSDAGLSQCRAGLYAAGEVNTRKAYEESKQLPKQTGLTDAISYALAYCLVGENKLNEAAGYLKNIDVQAVAHLTGESSVAGDIALAQGEIALRRRNYALAQHYAEIVSGAFAHAQVDEGDRKELVRLQEDIRKHSS